MNTSLTLADLLKQRWKVVFMTAAIFLSGGIFYLHMARHSYTVKLLVAPAQASAVSGPSDILKSLAASSGLSSLLGGGGGTTLVELFVQAVPSSDVARDLLDDDAVTQHIFANDWNSRTKQWRTSTRDRSSFMNFVRSGLGLPTRQDYRPNVSDMIAWIQNSVSINYSPETPTIMMIVKDPDPVFASNLLLNIEGAADKSLRKRAITRATSNLAYLRDQLKTVTGVEDRESLISALGEQERMLMSAKSNAPYAVEVFSGPVASSLPTDPDSKVVLIGTTVFGAVCGLALAYYWPFVIRLFQFAARLNPKLGERIPTAMTEPRHHM